MEKIFRKPDPYITIWQDITLNCLDWISEIVFLSIGIQSNFYARYCESIGFNSQAVGRLVVNPKRIKEDWEKDRKTLGRIIKKYQYFVKSIQKLANVKWSGRISLQTVYDEVKEQMIWISDTLNFIQGDLRSAKRIGNIAEVEEIKRYIKELTPQLKTIYGFYKFALQKIEDADKNLDKNHNLYAKLEASEI